MALSLARGSETISGKGRKSKYDAMPLDDLLMPLSMRTHYISCRVCLSIDAITNSLSTG